MTAVAERPRANPCPSIKVEEGKEMKCCSNCSTHIRSSFFISFLANKDWEHPPECKETQEDKKIQNQHPEWDEVMEKAAAAAKKAFKKVIYEELSVERKEEPRPANYRRSHFPGH